MASSYELVRVRDGGVEFTVSRAHAESSGLDPLDKPAVDDVGQSLPVKPVTPKTAAKPAAVKSDAKEA